MEAGRDLDALIGEKLFGRKSDYFKYAWGTCLCFEDNRSDVPHYSTDIKAAWEVIDNFRDDNFSIQENGTHWKVYFGTQWAGSESAPHAICLAALRFIDDRKSKALDQTAHKNR